MIAYADRPTLHNSRNGFDSTAEFELRSALSRFGGAVTFVQALQGEHLRLLRISLTRARNVVYSPPALQYHAMFS